MGGANAPAASAASASSITNEFGTLKVHKVTGEAKNGATFAGQYTVKRFAVGNGKVKAVGTLTGTLTKKSGSTKAVSERGVRIPLNLAASQAKNQAAQPTTSGTKSTSVISCDILHLVLGPLDLDLLGLVVHLDRVVLDIAAVPGAGNLLCAIVGLLVGTGIGGLSGILTNLLNALLGILQA